MSDAHTIRIPKALSEEAARIGIDVESRAIDLLLRELNLDSEAEVRVRLELAERYLREADEHLRRGDPAQSSEKLYKCVEECIKALARMYKIP